MATSSNALYSVGATYVIVVKGIMALSTADLKTM